MLRVISNPNSGRNRKNPKKIERLKKILGDAGEIRLPTSLEQLHQEIVAFRKEQGKILCINGGDGTIHQCLSALVKVYGNEQKPLIGILQGGTINNIPRNLGLCSNGEKMLKQIVTKQKQNAEWLHLHS